MSYALKQDDHGRKKTALTVALKRLTPVWSDEKHTVVMAFFTMLIANGASLLGPLIIGHTVDTYFERRNFTGVLTFSGILLAVYVCGLGAGYRQTMAMGTVGRMVLFKLRNALFKKLQELPLAFFNENKAGDVISRINNDTDKLNQFFAQGLVQLAGNLFMMTGAAIFLLILNTRLGIAALLPATGVLIFTKLSSVWVRSKYLQSFESLGGMSAEIQESLSNFRVIIAFNRLDYFRRKFEEANSRHFAASVGEGMAGGLFMPVYGLALNLAQLIVLGYGLYLIAIGQLTVGLLIGFLLYVNSFYMPLRQIGVLWSSLQSALAALERISEVLALKSNMPVVPSTPVQSDSVLEFHNVSFFYPAGKEVLRDVSFSLQPGRTYAFVGPTGGGKTTTASLMARLYDPREGQVLIEGKDLRSIQPGERARRIGFILQDPFLFTGTVRENILYGSEEYRSYTDEELLALVKERHMDGLLSRFEKGLNTTVDAGGDGISLGQKQLIAFMRAVLRDPQILILDEATANIDTVTERQLQYVIDKLPGSTTKIIIAHRLNTIANADEIFFVNSGEIIRAGSMQHALDMLLHGKRLS